MGVQTKPILLNDLSRIHTSNHSCHFRVNNLPYMPKVAKTDVMPGPLAMNGRIINTSSEHNTKLTIFFCSFEIFFHI